MVGPVRREVLALQVVLGGVLVAEGAVADLALIGAVCRLDEVQFGELVESFA